MAKFFRILLPGLEERMTIPGNVSQLLTDQRGTAAKTVSISSPLGKIWHVKLSRDRRNTYFTKGWSEFLEAHEMLMGDLMVFSYEGQSNFSVEIFDKTTCIKKYNCLNGQRDSHSPNSQLAYVVSPDRSNSVDFYKGGDGSSEYTTERNDSESSYNSSEGINSCGMESTVPDTTRVRKLKDGKAIMPSNVGKKTKTSDKAVISGSVANGRVNRRGRKSNENSKKNVKSNALPIKGYAFKTISEHCSFSYMPLMKNFCDSSQYKLTDGDATVRNEKLKAYPVQYRVAGSYNFIGKGWRKFCMANNVRKGDQCQIKIIGDNEFFVSFKHL